MLSSKLHGRTTYILSFVDAAAVIGDTLVDVAAGAAAVCVECPSAVLLAVATLDERVHCSGSREGGASENDGEAHVGGVWSVSGGSWALCCG
jgi:hypothetical protein